MNPTLIYCAAGNKRFAEIAIRYGLHYGAQLPATVYHAPYFVDCGIIKRNKQNGKVLVTPKPFLTTITKGTRAMATSNSITIKNCKKCGMPKPISEFGRHSIMSDGLRSVCKICNSTLSAQWQRANPERAAQRKHEWYETNKEKQKQSFRESYLKAKESGRKAEWNRRYNAKYPEKVRMKWVRYRTRKRQLPYAFSVEQWNNCLAHFDYCCVVCGRPAGLWHSLAADHWIPVTSSDCPGTVATNIVPLCQGFNGCNNSKNNRDASLWLFQRVGKRNAKRILERINSYFESVRHD